MPPPIATYLGRVDFARALAAQDEVADAITTRAARGRILGFECESVITLGLRGTADDVVMAGLPVVRVDRGGQATLHNPGQLVIFPVWPMADRGSKRWVEVLARVTERFARDLGHPLCWRDDQPGFYDPRGKVASLGLRVRRGVSTHGLAINVRNNLNEFNQIRACGHAGAALAHLRTDLALPELFDRWAATFAAALNVT